MVAIFDLVVTRMSESVHTSSVVLLDPGNVGVACRISLLSCIEAEILRYFICTSGNGAIFNWPLTPMSESVHTIIAVMLDPYNLDLAIGVSLLSCIEADIMRYFTYTSG